MVDSPRANAAKAKRAARLNLELPEALTNIAKPVQISDLSFAVDDETKRVVEEERSKVRDTLDRKA
jgi:hypothetical protein